MKAGGSSTQRRSYGGRPGRSLTLKDLANHLGLAPATVSMVMNGAVSTGIAPETQKLVLDAARKLNYRPNFFARCLRTRRSFTIGVIVPEVSAGYNILLLKGIEECLTANGYFDFIASHHFRPDLIEEYAWQFMDRAVDGLIVSCAPWKLRLPIPVATISCHHTVKGTTSILLDHHAAADAALRYLLSMGHRKIAFIKGTVDVPDTEVRWRAIAEAAKRLGLPIHPKLVEPIVDKGPASPQLGYNVTQKLLASGEKFTALFAFNDVSAMGAIRELKESNLRVPQDVSVVGFDDIYGNETYPGLTTIRQPLEEMGRLAAETILRNISRPAKEWNSLAARIVMQPELVVRESTGIVPDSGRKAHPASTSRRKR